MKNHLFLLETLITLLINLSLCFFFPLTKTNFTGLTAQYPLVIFLWVSFSCNTILHQIITILTLIQKKNKPTVLACFNIELFWMLALALPYDPANLPYSSAFHLLFSGIFFFSITALFLYTLFHAMPYCIKQAYLLFQFYFISLFLCCFIYMAYLSINGLFEIIYTCSMSICTILLLFIIQSKISKENS